MVSSLATEGRKLFVCAVLSFVFLCLRYLGSVALLVTNSALFCILEFLCLIFLVKVGGNVEIAS